MSDLGVLSHHYKASSDLAKALNQAVVALKKRFYGLVGGQDIPVEQMASHRRLVISVLNALLAEFAPSPRTDSGPERTELATQPADYPQWRIPASIVERIRQAHRGTMAYYLEDLISARDRLSQDSQELNEKDIELLDELAATASLDAAEVFRRMWKK